MDKSSKPLNKSSSNKKNYERDLEDSLRQENDKTANQLLHIASQIKSSALRFGGTITKSNTQLDGMNQKYEKSNNLVGDTIEKLSEALSHKSTAVCYGIIFLCVIMFFLYKMSN